MGLLPMNMDILPPSDDWVFKLTLTKDGSKAGNANYDTVPMTRTENASGAVHHLTS